LHKQLAQHLCSS